MCGFVFGVLLAAIRPRRKLILFNLGKLIIGIAKEHMELKKTMKAYEKVDLLILDEWLIRALTPNETYAMLELIETRTRHGATIFCTQFETEGWYARMDPNPESGSPICEAIMGRGIHNAYQILVDGEKSIRERHGLKAALE